MSSHPEFKNPIDRLIRPKSIAVFGGSWAHSVIEQCQKMGYSGELWPVHPTRESVSGLRCYSSIASLPAAPDVSFLGVNREITIQLVERLAAMGAGGAVCFASGFSEAIEEDSHADELQQALVQAAGSMPILGPNCYGFINCLDRALLWPDQHGTLPVDSGVAIVTQSSNIAINLSMQTRGLPVAYVFTAGNQACVSLAQLAMTALEDARVTAVGIHIEGFASIRDFELLALRARQMGKPIVALKVGKSESAQQALKSHTSSIAGSDASANAFLSRLGIARVHSLSVFLETLKIFHVGGALDSQHFLSMSCSGGEACLMGDAALEHNLHCPPLNDSQSEALRAALGPRVALANPLDYHTYIWNDKPAMQAMFEGMLKINAGIAILVIDFPRTDRCEYDSWLVAIEAFKQAGAGWSGQLAVLASLPENMPEAIAASLIRDNVIPLCGLDDAMAAIAAASTFVGLESTADETNAAAYQPVLLPTQQLETVDEIHSYEEAVAKQWLNANGVSVPQGVLLSGAEVQTTNDASVSAVYLGKQCAELRWPVVLKSTGSLHKSDTGGVILNLRNQAELQDAVAGMGPSAGFYVEEQIENSVCELLVGIVRDPVHGFLLTVAAGGVQTEIMRDSASALLPLSQHEIAQLLKKLRCFPVLEGYRGSAGCNMASLLETLCRVQQAAISVADHLLELEINPLLCTETDTIAVDALLRVQSPLDHILKPQSKELGHDDINEQ